MLGNGRDVAVFEARTHEGVPVHENGAQVAHEQGFDVELFAQAVGGNKVQAEVEFSEVENFHGKRTARRVRGSQPVGFLPDTLFGIVWRFEFARVGHGRRVP